jgi:hypothetical protein
MDCEDEVESVGWVQRTGEVSLDEGADLQDAAFADLYNEVLSALFEKQVCQVSRLTM